MLSAGEDRIPALEREISAAAEIIDGLVAEGWSRHWHARARQWLRGYQIDRADTRDAEPAGAEKTAHPIRPLRHGQRWDGFWGA